MGVGNHKQRSYYSVSFGKIRKKCDKDTPGATPRELKDKSIIHELVYDYFEGMLDDVEFRPDDGYGNGWIVRVMDGETELNLQLPEESAAGRDFLKKFPSLRKGQFYRFTPFDFVPKDSLKRKSGLSIATRESEKVPSYFHQYSGEKPNVKTTLLHGYPEYDGGFNKDGSPDKDDLKAYFPKVTKFLRNFAHAHLAGEFLNGAEKSPVEHDDGPDMAQPEKDDLPF